MEKSLKNAGMSSFIAMMAAMIPIEKQIEMIEDSINEYKSDPTPENLKKITAQCFLLINADVVNEFGGGLNGAMKLSSNIEEVKEKVEFFNTKNN